MSGTKEGSDQINANLPIQGKSPHDTQFKQDILEKLSLMREQLQPLLFNAIRPERNELVQRANFLYALMFKIKEEYKSGDKLLDYIDLIEKEYPLAHKTIAEVKKMPETQNDYLLNNSPDFKS